MEDQPQRRTRDGNTRRQTPALLKGIIFTETGAYYTSMDLVRNPPHDASAPLRLPAGTVENAVIGEVQRMIRARQVTARTIKLLRCESASVDEKAIVKALGEFDQLWAALYPAEQARIVQLLVTVGEGGIAVDLRHEGLGAVLKDMMPCRLRTIQTAPRFIATDSPKEL